jgi:hypothetical protein
MLVQFLGACSANVILFEEYLDMGLTVPTPNCPFLYLCFLFRKPLARLLRGKRKGFNTPGASCASQLETFRALF